MIDDKLSDMVLYLGASSGAVRKGLGQRARDLRLMARRSQAGVAAAAGVSLPTLQRFEAGANVSVDVLVRVAFVLGSGPIVSQLFPQPDARSIDEIVERRQLPQRGRRK